MKKKLAILVLASVPALLATLPGGVVKDFPAAAPVAAREHLTNLPVVPEPGTVALLGVGLIGLTLRWRYRPRRP